MRKHTFILGILFTLILALGLVLKFLHIAGANEAILIANTLFIVVFSISYLIDRLRKQQRRAFKLSTIVLLVSIQSFMFASNLVIMKLPGGPEMTIIALILITTYFVFFSTQSEDRKLQLRRNRQLAAILFTDIVGFTSMMGDDEQEALRILDSNRSIQKRIIEKHRGKWLKEMGDGSLVIFYTATEAITAAVEIQSRIQETGKFNVRMGIHLSEIVFSNKDVFGDGVNVASRISDKAEKDEIAISDSVYQNIKNREDLQIDFLGEFELKNVSYPLRIHKITT